MNKNIVVLKEKFEIVKDKGWLCVPRKGFGEVGLLFENEIGLNNHEFPIADFNGIEIKVQNRHSKHPLTLFSSTCDGPDFYELRRIVNKYGICDYDYECAKILFISLYCNSYSTWGRFLKMKLYVDRKKQRLYIVVSHVNGKIIEKRAYWEFSVLKEKLYRKLKVLCYVVSDSSFSHGMHFVKYNDIHFYKLRNFDNFIDLLERGKIRVNIKCGVYKHGSKKGKSYDHGTAFQIEKDGILELYDSIFS